MDDYSIKRCAPSSSSGIWRERGNRTGSCRAAEPVGYEKGKSSFPAPASAKPSAFCSRGRPPSVALETTG